MQVKGMAFNARLEFIKARFGEDRLDDVLDTVAQVKALMTSAGTFYPSTLYEYDHYTAFNQAICDKLYGGDEKAFVDMGEESAEGALKSVHKIFVMNRDVRSFLRSLPVIYAAYYVEMGEAKIEIKDTENRAIAEVHIPARAHRSVCQIVKGYMTRGMELCGAANIRIQELSCCTKGDNACRMDIAWD